MNTYAHHSWIYSWEWNCWVFRFQEVELLSFHLREMREMSPKVKDKLLHLAPPTTLKTGTMPSGQLRFWSQHIPYLSILLQPIYQVT